MTWEEIAARAGRLGAAPEALLREEAQKAVLAFLSLREFFAEAVLQGGTALRLFHGSPRFSEDLDFAFTARDARLFREAPRRLAGLEAFVAGAFPFLREARLAEQRPDGSLRRFALRLGLPPGGALRINVEFANVPSRDHAPAVLRYPPLNPVVRVESPAEILADKVVAAALRRYVKGRDLWDIRYLAADRKERADPLLVARKAEDYGVPAGEFAARLAAAAEKARREGRAALEREMRRFLPPSAAAACLREAAGMARDAASLLESAAAEIARLFGEGGGP